MIITCDAKDVGRILETLPQRATFTAVKANEEPKLGPVGQQIASEIGGHRRKVKLQPARNPSGKKMKDVILEELAKGPKSPSELTRLLVGAGFKKDSTSGRLWELIHRDQTIRREGGMYYLIANTETHAH